MNIGELRQKYLDFFTNKGHTVIPSASLIPENDPTVLFTTAGMHPLVPFLMGEKHPGGKRLTGVQKCIRTGDIDEVGDRWHLTFFEMLGNWSLGDYFKKESIEWSYEFLTSPDYLGINPEKISVSVFKGDDDAPRDEEAAEIWQSVGIPKERIYFYDKKENWWDPAGETGPCGPDTEIFYDSGLPKCSDDCEPKCSCGKYVEIWNNVFMQYNKTKDGKYEILKQKNVDTGMGLERTVAILNGCKSVYEIDSFKPVIDKIIELSDKKGVSKEEILKSEEKSIRVIADHIKTATFILGDPQGVSPSNVDQGYVLRRLIRRAIRHAKMIGIDKSKELTTAIAKEVIKVYKDQYNELEQNEKRILSELKQEEEKFEKTLEQGIKRFDEYYNLYLKKQNKDEISPITGGKFAFDLFQTYGFPLEMTLEEFNRRGMMFIESAIRENFNKEMEKHQELSRTASAGKFKGGLADASEETKKLHTATHLLHQALRQVLGNHVEQRGSNITPERLRFDFIHSEKMTDEEKKKVEEIVNEQITKDLPVNWQEMSVEEAKKAGALGLFEHKYGEKVKVYTIGDPEKGTIFSREICGGPHVNKTAELGKFKIKKEESSSAGVRRIKAFLS